AVRQLLLAYQNVLAGRDGTVEMATFPLCFSSAPVVSYRAAASRNKVAGYVAARHERQGTALVVPPRSLDVVHATQETFEEAFRLDRRAPFFTTHPINVGAALGADRGTEPAPRRRAPRCTRGRRPATGRSASTGGRPSSRRIRSTWARRLVRTAAPSRRRGTTRTCWPTRTRTSASGRHASRAATATVRASSRRPRRRRCTCALRCTRTWRARSTRKAATSARRGRSRSPTAARARPGRRRRARRTRRRSR